VILAVDIGTATLGWAVVRPGTAELVDLGVIVQPADPELGVHEGRRRRIRRQTRMLREVVMRHGCTHIAGEELSYGGPPKARVAMATCQALCWGALEAIAIFLDLEVVAIPPKTWEKAIVPEATGKIDYDTVYERISSFVGAFPALRRIPAGQRNHALDGVGIGVYAARRHFTTLV
jgi:Holliday junction resolvasome RuvABC endonuclease subunit